MDFAVIDVKSAREYIIIYAKSEHGDPYVIFVRGFKHNIYVPVAEFRNKITLNGRALSEEEFANKEMRMKCIARYINFEDIHEVVRRNGYGYHEPEPFIQIACPDQDKVYEFTTFFKARLIPLFDANASPVERFMTQRKISGNGWFHVDRYEDFPIPPRCTYKNLIIVDDIALHALPLKTDAIPNFRILTLDIEALINEDKLFPTGMNNQCIQISMETDTYTKDGIVKDYYLFGLRESGVVFKDGKKVHCYAFDKNESVYIAAFLKEQREICTIIEAGYNEAELAYLLKGRMPNRVSFTSDIVPLQPSSFKTYGAMLKKVLRYATLLDDVDYSEVEQFARMRAITFDHTKENCIFPQFNIFNIFNNVDAFLKQPYVVKEDRPWLELFLHVNDLSMDLTAEEKAKLEEDMKAVDDNQESSPKEKRRKKDALMETARMRAENRFFLMEGMALRFVNFLEQYLFTEEESNMLFYLHPLLEAVTLKASYADERDMLLKFREIFLQFDPDVVSWYNGNMFDMPFLLDCCIRLGISIWDFSLGRPAMSKKAGGNIYRGFTKLGEVTEGDQATGAIEDRKVDIPGRVVVDVLKVVRKEIHISKVGSFSLNAVSFRFLKRTKKDVEVHQIAIYYNGSVAQRQLLWEYNLEDSVLPPLLMAEMKWLDVIFQLSRCTGINMQDVYGAGKSKMGVYLYLTFAHAQNIVLPYIQGQREPFKGAHVFSPRKGMYLPEMIDGKLVYKQIVNNDFAGMYPSIIREYNLCMSTYIPRSIVLKEYPSTAGANAPYEHPQVFLTKSGHYFRKDIPGFLPSIVAMAVEERDKTKGIIKKLNGQYYAFSEFFNLLKYGSSIEMCSAVRKAEEEEKLCKEVALLKNQMEESSSTVCVLRLPDANISSVTEEEIAKVLPALRKLLGENWGNEALLRTVACYIVLVNVKLQELDKALKYYDVRQLALKIIANSMYGIIGSFKFKWPLTAVAASVTAQGQWLIKDVVQPTILEMDKTKMVRLVYGDTDSLFYMVPYQTFHEAKAFSMAVSDKVNEKLNSRFIRLEAEHVLLKSIFPSVQKTYAGLEIFEKGKPALLVRGYSMKKCSYPAITKEIGNYCMSAILENDVPLQDVFRYLHQQNELLETLNTTSNLDYVEKFILHAKWGKDLDKYANVNAVSFLNDENNKARNPRFFKGDRIPYFRICGCGDKQVDNIHLASLVLRQIIQSIDNPFPLTLEEKMNGKGRPLLDINYYRQTFLLTPLIHLFPGHENQLYKVFVSRGQVPIIANPLLPVKRMDAFLEIPASSSIKLDDAAGMAAYYEELERENDKHKIEVDTQKKFEAKRRKIDRAKENNAMANSMAIFLASAKKTSSAPPPLTMDDILRSGNKKK